MILRGWLGRTDIPDPFAEGLLAMDGKQHRMTAYPREFGEFDVCLWNGAKIIGKGTLGREEFQNAPYEGEIMIYLTRWWVVGTPEETEHGRRLALTFSKPRPVMPPAAPGQHWRDTLGEETSHE